MVSALGFLVTLFLGLVGWRVQLIGKRRTEVAEEALLAFAQAVDAIEAIRSPMSTSGEHEAVRKEADRPAEEKLPGEGYHVTLWRIRQHRERFLALRRLRHLCRYHFGQTADSAFNELDDAVQLVTVSALMLATPEQPGDEPTPEDRKLSRQWRGHVWKGASQPDEIADRIAAAQRDLEASLAPHLRADAALLPIAIGWRSARAWIMSRVTLARGRGS